jgi:transposase
MTRLPPNEFAAFVGIDWATTKHDVCMLAAGSETRECRGLEHTPATIDAWVNPLRQRCKEQPIAMGLELNNGPIVYALRTDDFLVLLPGNPLPLARDRDAFTPSHAKDDPPDAELQLERLLKHRDTLKPLQPQSPAIRALAQLVTHRRRLVSDPVRRTNRLTSTLKNYFPQVLQWWHDQDTAIFCDFLAPWPTLKAVQLARRATLARVFHAHHVRYADVIDERIQAIKGATPLTTGAGVSVPPALLVQALVTPLRVTLPARADFDTAIAQRAQRHPDFPLFDTLPGAGAVLAPRLLVACGEQRERYASAEALQKYAGSAPVTERSGNKTWVPWRLQCPKVLRQTFVEWAAASIRHSFWARPYAEQQRDKGTAHQAAVRALACQWLRLLFRCWQNRRPYDASVSLNALQRRGAPLMPNLATSSSREFCTFRCLDKGLANAGGKQICLACHVSRNADRRCAMAICFPAQTLSLLQGFAPCFTAPSFAYFQAYGWALMGVEGRQCLTRLARGACFHHRALSRGETWRKSSGIMSPCSRC